MSTDEDYKFEELKSRIDRFEKIMIFSLDIVGTRSPLINPQKMSSDTLRVTVCLEDVGLIGS